MLVMFVRVDGEDLARKIFRRAQNFQKGTFVKGPKIFNDFFWLNENKKSTRTQIRRLTAYSLLAYLHHLMHCGHTILLKL